MSGAELEFLRTFDEAAQKAVNRLGKRTKKLKTIGIKYRMVSRKGKGFNIKSYISRDELEKGFTGKQLLRVMEGVMNNYISRKDIKSIKMKSIIIEA